MTIEQFYLGCLSQASYLVYDPTTLKAMVVDPRRDVGEYLARADELHLSIEHVLLTHVHADFVPGYAELERATGATVAMSERSPVTFPIRRLADGDRIDLGDSTGVTVEVLATPGHTPESITLAVFERATDATPIGLLTGDTLFIGDVGRPDLLGAAGLSAEDMARDLYRSLRERVLPLPDSVIIWPGHGAGSACGKALSTDTSSTLGEQRSSNYALADMSADRFVEVITEGLGDPPAYFSGEVALNRRGHLPMDDAAPAELALSEVARQVRDGSLALDVRDPQDFAAGHITGSVNVGLSGRFAEFAAAVREPDQPIVLIGSAEEVVEAKVRLARVGLDHVVGALADPVPALAHEPTHAQRASRVTAAQFTQLLAADADVQLVDVRGPGEHADGAIPDSLNLPLPRLLSSLDRLDRAKPVLAYCAGGYRSAVAASLLRAKGFDSVTDLLGGFAAWESNQVPAG